MWGKTSDQTENNIGILKSYLKYLQEQHWESVFISSTQENYKAIKVNE